MNVQGECEFLRLGGIIVRPDAYAKLFFDGTHKYLFYYYYYF